MAYKFRTTPPYTVGHLGGSVTIAGTTYRDTDDPSKFDKLPTSTVNRVARWTVANIDPLNHGDTVGKGGFGSMDAHAWLAHTGSSKAGVLTEYMHDVYEYSSGDVNKPAVPVPGAKDPTGGAITGAVGSVAASINSVTDFLKLLADPHLWVRIAEVLIGAALVAVGAAHLSGSANTILKATPLIGKVL